MEKKFETNFEHSKEVLNEQFFTVRVVEISSDVLKTERRVFSFSVTPDHTIYLTTKGHHFLAENYGVDLDTTLTEGYLDTRSSPPKIRFKVQPYQPYPGFQGTEEELKDLEKRITKKILETLA